MDIIDNACIKDHSKMNRIVNFLNNNTNEWDVYCGILNKIDDVKIIYPFPLLIRVKETTYNIEDNYIIINKKSNTRNKIITSWPSLFETNLTNKINEKYVSCELVGALGNQMFILATTFALALEHKLTISFLKQTYYINPDWNLKDYQYWDNYFKFIDLIPYDGFNERISNTNGPYGYEKLNINPKTQLYGYFQNEKYFGKYKRDIVNFFQINAADKEYIENKYKWILNDNLVMIHVRRGDYLKHTKCHHVVPIEYYNKAKNIIGKNSFYVVFSDSIDWCKKNIKADIYVEGEKDYIDMQMMRYFHTYVISNSSFAWWGAYLSINQNINVYMPCKWLEKNKAYPHGLVIDGWKIIKY